MKKRSKEVQARNQGTGQVEKFRVTFPQFTSLDDAFKNLSRDEILKAINERYEYIYVAHARLLFYNIRREYAGISLTDLRDKIRQLMKEFKING